MLQYHIEISCDEEFGVHSSYGFSSTPNIIVPDGISVLRTGGNSSVNPNIFLNKDFFKPVLKLLNFNKRFKDITTDEFKNLFSEFGELEEGSESNSWETTLGFQMDNECDLMYIYLSKRKGDISRILFQYKNCPINSFYCMDDGKHITIQLSPYSKTYWTISETEWWYFTEYLKNEKSLIDKRDQKLRELLDDNSPNFSNIIRQLEFIVKCDKKTSNSFIDSVHSYYEKNGFITKRQADAVAKTIW